MAQVVLRYGTMTKEITGQDGDSADLHPGAKALALVRRGPVIAIEVDTQNFSSPARMQNQIDVVRDISETLDAADIGHMLTGSMALNCYDLPCLPRSLDFVVTLRPEEAAVMVRLFSPVYHISRDAVDRAIAQQSSFSLCHRENRIRVNCFICQQTKYRQLEFNRRQRVKFENFKTWIVNKEDLIISKLHWARKSHSARHLRDVQNLVATRCDTNYIERWTRALGIFKLWQECSHPEVPALA